MRKGTVRRFHLVTGQDLGELVERADQWIDQTGATVVSYTVQPTGLHPSILLFYEDSGRTAGESSKGE